MVLCVTITLVAFIDPLGLAPTFYQGKPNVYARYSVINHAVGIKHFDEVNINLELKRIITWHNFFKGTLWLKYTVVVTDKSGNRIFGGWDVPVKLTIERSKGTWSITEIFEGP